ncbi:MAG: hypothetical protein FWC00_05870, partial [Firmicutes bacterium]|nr:hypothetical protein [Bacillota bacterium]
EKALEITEKRERYEYVYDAICNFLDSDFKQKNHCEFVDGKCFVNRKDSTGFKHGGCCCSYDYTFLLNIKRRKTCKYLSKSGCEVKCLTCKAYTCASLRMRGVEFKVSKIPNIKKVFSRKQILVLDRNFFCTKEDIINRLLAVEKNLFTKVRIIRFGKNFVKD